MVTIKAKTNPVTVVPHVKIREVGSFNYKEVYEQIGKWMSKNKYIWREKTNQSKTNADGKEIKVEWAAFRKIDDYVKFNIEIEYYITYFVEEEGGYANCTIEISISSNMEKNYHKNFSEHAGTFSNFLREIYEGYLIKGRLSGFEGKIWAETYDLIDGIKEILRHAKRK